jgi:hypothetical protein
MSTIKSSTTTTTAYSVEADTTGALVIQTGATPTTAVTISTGQVATFAQAPVLPAASIPQAALAAGVAGNGPAFSAYAGTSTTLTNNVDTKVLFDTEEFDTNNNFASSRFTPTVAGYYQINSAIRIQNIVAGNTVYSNIYKNGSAYKLGTLMILATTSDPILVISSIVYMNGSTDYVEIYGYQNFGSTRTTQASSATTYFNGAMIRSA